MKRNYAQSCKNYRLSAEDIAFEKTLRAAVRQFEEERRTVERLEKKLACAVAEGHLLSGIYYDASSGDLLIPNKPSNEPTRIIATTSGYVAMSYAVINHKLAHIKIEGDFFKILDPTRKVKVKHRNDHITDTPIVKEGYVLILPKDNFEQDPNLDWKYIHDGPVKILDQIKIRLEEFPYQIYDSRQKNILHRGKPNLHAP